MCDEQREVLKNIILSWIGDVARQVGLYNIKVKEEKSLINKYYNGISQVQKSRSVSEDEIGWNAILECFMQSLNISPNDVLLKPNQTPNDFEENMDIVFRSIGLPKGIENVLECSNNRNPEAKSLIKQAMEKADAIRGSKSWRSENFLHCTVNEGETTPISYTKSKEDILTFPILKLPQRFCSKKLITKLSKRFSYVYELLSIDFDELKSTLCDNDDNIPTKLLTELEFFFRSYDIDYLDHIEGLEQKDIMIKTIIRDAVTVAMAEITSYKSFE